MDTVRAADVESNLTKCAVCHDIFTDPKILPCGHVMCRDCLVTWLQSQPQAACPSCQNVIVEPTKQGGRSVEAVADGLPTDLAMAAMVEAETLLSKQHVCCVHDDVVAVAVCLQCGDMFCQNCRNVHKRQKATMHHGVEELSTLTTERFAAYHPATCPDHKDDISEVYCHTHDASVCVLCATTTHRDCPKVVSLQSLVDELTAELAQLRGKLIEGAAKEDARLCLLDKRVEKLQTESKAALNELKSVCDRLKEAIDDRFLEISNMTSTLVSDFTEKATGLKKNIIQKHSKLSAHYRLTDMYKKFTEHKYFKEMVSVVKGRLPDIALTDSLPEDLQLNQKLMLTIDPQAVADAERIIWGLGGNVTMTPVDNVDETSPDDTTQGVQCGSSCEQSLAAPAFGFVMETRTPGDCKQPDITSIATWPSRNEVYVTDPENQSIKVFSLNSRSVISTLTLNMKPRRLALVRENLLAVTLCKKNISLG